MLKHLVDTFKAHQTKIDEWFKEKEEKCGRDPVYASVDLRNAGYKIAPVDTNIFPAGFNNLCPSYRREAGKHFKAYIDKYHAGASKILILAEEHTRNLYYFENLHALTNLLREAGFTVEVGSLRHDLTKEMTEFPTAENKTMQIWKAKVTGYLLKTAAFSPDLILVNNDFSGGVPTSLNKIAQPMIPTPRIGWHSRKKSDHFSHYSRLAAEFSKLINIDPWLITGNFRKIEKIDFDDTKSMARLAAKADILIAELRPHYKEYKLKEEPYLFVKNDAGTYGMAIMTVQSGDELLHLNKKQRAKMKVGKNLRRVTEVIIQEGIPTIDRFKGLVAEPVIYLVAHRVCGGFFRLNETGDSKGNLNQPGMKFSKLCFHEMFGYSNEYTGECDLECLAMVYKNIARIASLAAGCEIKHLP